MNFVFCWGCLHYDDIFSPFLQLLLGSINIFREKMKMLIYLFIYFFTLKRKLSQTDNLIGCDNEDLPTVPHLLCLLDLYVIGTFLHGVYICYGLLVLTRCTC